MVWASNEFTFANRGNYWESLEEIPEPYGFEVTRTLGHSNHDHCHVARFVERMHGHDGHDHDQVHALEDDPLYAPTRGGVAVLLCHVHVHRHGGTLHAH